MLRSCEGCPFWGAKCGSRGACDAPLLIVGEAPGAEELRFKPPIPFSGPSGRLLWESLPDDIHPDRGNVFVTNSMQCRPRGNKKLETKRKEQAVTLCRDRVLEEVRSAPRKLIIALGNYALRSLTGQAYKITQVRGRIIPSDLSELGILPVIHPAAILRGTGSYRLFTADLAYAVHLFRGGEERSPVMPRVTVPKTLSEARTYARRVFSRAVTKFNGEVSGDIETTGFSRISDKILSHGVAYDARTVIIFPDDILTDPVVKYFLGHPSLRYTFHNGKFDVSFLQRDGMPIEVADDTMLMSYALDETGGIHGLEDLSKDLLGAQPHKHLVDPYVKGKKKKYGGKKSKGKREVEKGNYGDVPRDILYKYQAFDVSYMHQIKAILKPQVMDHEATRLLYTRTLLRASPLLQDIEQNGMYADVWQLWYNAERLEKEVADRAEDVNKVAQEVTGDPLLSLNVRSPKQLAGLLFDALGLRKVSGRSTNKEVLEKLVELYPDHPVLRAIMAHRKAAKQLGTYVYGTLEAIQEDDRVHGTYLIHGTRTGRLSSRKPNMQNQPRVSAIRAHFRAPEKDRILIAVDLNQAELRSLAHCSGDSLMCAIYKDPTKGSMHDEVAVLKYGDKYIDAVKLSKTIGDLVARATALEMKMKAKNINFGVVYGITAAGLAEEMGCSRQEAEEFLKWWFNRFPDAYEFIQSCRRAAARGQTITTVFGRQKRHWIVTRENLHSLGNEAANFPHQSIAHDIVLHTGIKIRERNLLKGLSTFFVNEVHDELLMEGPDDPDTVKEVLRIVTREMEATPLEWQIDRVPFKAEGKVGYRWGFLADVEVEHVK